MTETPIQPRRSGADTPTWSTLTLDQSLAMRAAGVRKPILTMAELGAGPHAATTTDERARRQDRLQRAEAAFDPLPFDAEAARAYGRIYAAVVATARKARGPRAVDLLIAATACAHQLPLFTRNLADFRGLEALVDVIDV